MIAYVASFNYVTSTKLPLDTERPLLRVRRTEVRCDLRLAEPLGIEFADWQDTAGLDGSSNLRAENTGQGNKRIDIRSLRGRGCQRNRERRRVSNVEQDVVERRIISDGIATSNDRSIFTQQPM